MARTSRTRQEVQSGLAAAPIDLGDLLVETLFSRVETTILTSATLATRKNFSFLRKRIGLHKEQLAKYDVDYEINDRIILSPFNFQDQTILAVPTDLPSVEEGSGAVSYTHLTLPTKA